MKLGKILKEELKKRNLTQYQLSKMSGLSQTSISALTRGERGISAYSLSVLAKSLNVSADYLLGNEVASEKAKIGDVVLDRTNLMKGELGVVIADNGYYSLMIRKEGNEMKECTAPSEKLEVIGHIDFEKIWQQAESIRKKAK